jgi:hypothetical protein
MNTNLTTSNIKPHATQPVQPMLRVRSALRAG